MARNILKYLCQNMEISSFYYFAENIEIIEAFLLFIYITFYSISISN